MSDFRRIGLMGRLVHNEAAATLHQLRRWLAQRGLDVVLEAELAAQLRVGDVVTEEAQRLGAVCDLVVVVGGDGSLLAAARSLCWNDAPVVGINRGRLGFLTDVLPAQIESSLGAVLEGDYSIESRFLLGMELYRGDQLLGTGIALNDVVLDSGVSARMIEFELYIEDRFVYRQRSDGLIVSTPTGSTAYALSAGGPIMHPGLDALALVPMHPHTLGSRPLVVGGNSRVRIVINDYNELHPIISCDGQVNLTAAPGDEIHVGKSPEPLQLLHPPGQDFYASCRDKLGWGNRPGSD